MHRPPPRDGARRVAQREFRFLDYLKQTFSCARDTISWTHIPAATPRKSRVEARNNVLRYEICVRLAASSVSCSNGKSMTLTIMPAYRHEN